MKMPSYRKFNKEVVTGLMEKFLDGDKFTIEELASQYLGDAKTQLAQILNYRRARGWINSCKRHLKIEGEFLTVVDTDENDRPLFGIVHSAGQARMAMHHYYVLTKGIVTSANNLYQVVRSQGLLKGQTTSETLSLPKPKGEK